MSTSIGVIGAGPVGRGIATLLGRAGDEVLVATRNPRAPAMTGLAPSIAIGTARQAAEREIVFTAVLHSAARDLLTPMSPLLAGKTVIDAMNPWLPRAREDAGMLDGETEGSWLARTLPSSRIVRAFSHIDWDLLVPAATETPGMWAAGYAADDAEAGAVAEALITRMGYQPVRIGDLAHSAALDPGGRFFGRMLRPSDMLARIS
jgi:predicted dinucleotide-binding enzyme